MIPAVSRGADQALLLSSGNPGGHAGLVGPIPIRPDTARLLGILAQNCPILMLGQREILEIETRSPVRQSDVASETLQQVTFTVRDTGEERAEPLRYVAKPCSPLREMQGTGLVLSNCSNPG